MIYDMIKGNGSHVKDFQFWDFYTTVWQLKNATIWCKLPSSFWNVVLSIIRSGQQNIRCVWDQINQVFTKLKSKINNGRSKSGRLEICRFWGESDLNKNQGKSHVLPICLPIHENKCKNIGNIIKIQNKQRSQLTNTSLKRCFVNWLAALFIPIAWFYNQNGGSQSKRKCLRWFLKEHSCIWIGTGSDQSHIFGIGNRHCRFWVGSAIII